MIYLIATSMLFVEDMHSETILKIGYSDDARGEGRFQDYQGNGMIVKVLSTLPGGSIILEGLVQDYFKEFSIPSRSKEWFFYKKEIVDFFNSFENSTVLARYLIENFMIQGDKVNFYLLPSLRVQMDILLEGYKSDHGEDSIYFKLETFSRLQNFQEKLKFICDLSNQLNDSDFYKFINVVPSIYSDCYHDLGPRRLKALEYRRKEIIKEYDRLYTLQTRQIDITSAVFDKFSLGGRYRNSEIKEMFREIFDSLGITESPKAVLIFNYFEVRKIIITNKITKKKDRGFEILARKEK